MITLNDLKPKTITAEIELPDGTIQSIELMPLSWSQWQDIGLLVPNEKAELKPVVKNGKKEYEEDLPAQRRLDAENEMKRTKLRLAESLLRAGSLPELEKMTTEQRLNALGEIDTGIFNALILVLRQTALGSQARIADKAERFQ
jgi:hypothetical protein